MERKKILVLAYEYLPTENANTKIIRELCVRMADRCDIDLVTVKTPGTKDREDEGSFRILRVPEYSFHREKCTGPVTPGILARMTAEKALAKWTHDETRMVERLYEHGIRKAVTVSGYDAVVSFSAPFPAHGCASRIARETGTPWIAVCFDPYFDCRIFSPERLEERKTREEKTFAPAARVLMTYPTDRDYLRAGVAFSSKIMGMEMPGIAPRVQAAQENRNGAGGTVRCCFFGMLYREIRDPRPAIALFTEAGDGIKMRFAGVIDGAEKEVYFPEGCACRHIGRLAGEALEKEYEAADILVNIGNAVDNQMPSKIFEYISTGKPVINIYKSADCPTLKYMEKYPAALNIFEGDIEANLAETAKRVREFCLESRGKRVPAETIRNLYAENTFDHFAGTLGRVIDGALREAKN